MAIGALFLLAGFFGCQPPPAPAKPRLYVAPLARQQADAYPETIMKMFVSLADFEGTGDSVTKQLRQFTFSRATAGTRRLIVSDSRTGIGAMEVVLPPKTQLIYKPDLHDFSGYAYLISMAIHSEQVRDDLRVTITAGDTRWTSPPTLLYSGWNTVLFDIRRLTRMKDFDIRNVRDIRLEFADAVEPVSFRLDDIMLIDNRRDLVPVPPGITLRKEALDYALSLPGLDAPMNLAQDEDGLWRWGDDQPLIHLAGKDEELPDSPSERLSPMGTRRVGMVEVLESNPIRVRWVNTWYFPSRAGQWVSLGVRRVRWEQTLYGDGRVVTFLEFNNSGGPSVTGMTVSFPREVAVAGMGMLGELRLPQLTTVVKRWSYLDVSPVPQRMTLQRNYLSPPQVLVTVGDFVVAPGDLDRDGFDESQGCYVLTAKAGHCRFTLVPPVEGVSAPVFRVQGPWRDLPNINCDGVAITNVVHLTADHSILFQLPGRITRETAVEVEGVIARYED